MKKYHVTIAGVIAFMLGVPLAHKAFGLGIFWNSIGLADAIVSASSSDS